MVSIEVTGKGCSRRNVKITGDFFLHPECALEQMEEALAATDPSFSESEIAERILASLEGADLIGASPADLARIFKKAAFL